MSLALYDRVRETTGVLGTSDAVLLGAVIGYQSFAVVGNTNTCYYTIADSAGNWEVGLGTYSTTGPTLARTTVLSSSNANAKVSFPAGTKDIFLTYPAEKSVSLDANGKIEALNNSYIDYASASPTVAAGRMWYDGATGSWNLGMGGGNITQQVGEETFVYGKATAAISGNTLLQAIYKTGTVGASGAVTFAPTIAGLTDPGVIIGVATEDIANNGFGRITAFGVIHGINTSGSTYGETWADNDDIWYNPVTGGLTHTKPSAPNMKFQIGTVINAAGGAGSFQVLLQAGSTLGGTDSNVGFGTLNNGDLIQYSTGLGYWTNVAPSSIVTGAGGSNTQVQYNNSGALAGSANMTFDGTSLTLANDATIHGLTVGLGGGAVASNTAVGYQAGYSNTTGTPVTAVGSQAAYANTTGANIVAVGNAVLRSNTTGNLNTSVGDSSLYSNTTGSYNTALGVSALTSNTTANNNTAVGYQAGYSNTTATRFTAVGNQAGYLNNSSNCSFFGAYAGYFANGQYNTGLGDGALAGVYGLTTGTENTAVGYNALTGLTTGANNVAIASVALTSNTSGSNNVAIGQGALQLNSTASNNTAVGYQAGYSNTTGTLNAYLGTQAGYNNQTAGQMTAMGYQALYSATAGSNLAIGYQAARSTTTGLANTAIGDYQALFANTTGSYNVAIGNSTLQANTTASNNTAVGYQAGFSNTTGVNNVFTGQSAGYSNVTGYENTFVGDAAGLSTTGADNTFIGQGAGRQISTGSNNTILGRFIGNQNGLDIRTADNNIVLSDGAGTPQLYYLNSALTWVFPNLPTSAAGLPTGAIWKDASAGNVIKVV